MAAKYKTGNDAKYAETLVDDDEQNEKEEENDHDHEIRDINDLKLVNEDDLLVATSFGGSGKQPFSALNPTICPRNVDALRIEDHTEYRWDVFGFRVDVEDGSEGRSSKILSERFVEDPHHRLKWLAHLEFTHSHVVEQLTWRNVESVLHKSDKLQSMVFEGVPHSLRPFIWGRLCNAVEKRRNSSFCYRDVIKQAIAGGKSVVSVQIEKDLLRTIPMNICFSNRHSAGVYKLNRVLRAVAYLYPDLGYCQGMGVIVACLLLFCEESTVFWIMSTLIEDILPARYFSGSLLGLQADQLVLRQLISSHLPKVDRVLISQDIDLSLITLHWFLTLFASVLHMKLLLRIWDVIFYEGSTSLFRITLAMFKLRQDEIDELADDKKRCSDLFNLISSLPGRMENADILLTMAANFTSIDELLISSLRRKHLAILMADHGMLISRPSSQDHRNLPKQHVVRRKLRRSRSLILQIFDGPGNNCEDAKDEDAKLKNVRQTELLVDLKEAITAVCQHFVREDPDNYGHISFQADFRCQSHADDHARFLLARRAGQKRARAVLDFKRQDDDELGFRRNDIVTILSERDEHCWVGELNGCKGWFPAKFVQKLDERGKQYSKGGDDAVSTTVIDLIRGGLSSSIKAILEHGLRKSSVLAGPGHPWLFIEEVARREVQRDFKSVYSRLVLCRTFRLDEDGKVLTPEELLFRTVQTINASHDRCRMQMDVKLRSLVCVGLNEQCLHLWIELLCCSVDQEALRTRWYHQWAFVCSPVWVQIKCELRLLSQLPLNLNPDYELPADSASRTTGRKLSLKLLSPSTNNDVDFGSISDDRPLKEGVRDMLVKHHLFSWDL